MALNPKVVKYVPTSNKAGTEINLGIGLEVGDVEQLACEGITKFIANPNYSFVSVSTLAPHDIPAKGEYESYNQEDLIHTRLNEAKKAANIGGYHASYILNYTKETFINEPSVVQDYADIINAYQPNAIYTYSPFELDRQKLRVLKLIIRAILHLDPSRRPEHLYAVGLNDVYDIVTDKSLVKELDVDSRLELCESLLSVYDTKLQADENLVICSRAIDLMPLIKENPSFSIKEFASNTIDSYKQELLKKFD